MKVKVLGCHGGHAPGYDTTSYLINDRFLIDAGSICDALTLEQQSHITDIVITHSHLDHIKDLCFLLENTLNKERKPLNVYSTPLVIKALKDHVFNDLIWPDFTTLNVPGNPPILNLVEVSNAFSIGTFKIKPFKVNHPANAVGYVVDDGDVQVVFTGDSGPTQKIWDAANACENLKAIFTEVSFPSKMDLLAKATGHFTLNTLSKDLKKLNASNIPIYISHFKPLFMEELLDEFQSGASESLKTLHADDEIHFI